MQPQLSTTGCCWIDKTAAHCLAAQSVPFQLRECVYIYIFYKLPSWGWTDYRIRHAQDDLRDLYGLREIRRVTDRVIGGGIYDREAERADKGEFFERSRTSGYRDR